MEAEIKLKEFYDKRVKLEEDIIFNRAKLNKDVLMKYIKKKNKSSSKIGPFIVDKKVVEENEAETLLNQYL